MIDYSDFEKLVITMKESKISSIVIKSTGEILKYFPNDISKKNIPKIYIIKENNDFLYIGVTTQSGSIKIQIWFKRQWKKWLSWI